MRFFRFVSLTALVLVAACASKPVPVPPAPSPPPVAAPTPAPAPPPQPAYAHWSDAPATPGDWSWRQSGSDSIADFHSPQGQLLFEVACTEQQQVFLSATQAGQGAAALTVRTETAELTLPAIPGGQYLRAAIFARDPLLDAIAFSKGRFALEVAGAPTLYLPAYPEISRVIEDCR